MDILSVSNFSAVCLLLVAGILMAYKFMALKKQPKTMKSTKSSKDDKVSVEDPRSVFSDIVPINDFNWRETKPQQLRPSKQIYHMTMAIENIPLSDLIAMDNTYLERLNLRRKLIKEQGRNVVAANDCIAPAVNEHYTWLTSTYLPQRFPSMFRISEDKKVLHNLTTHEDIPLQPPSDIEGSLRILSSNVDTEFYFLRHAPERDNKYVLEAYSSCSPSFDQPSKLNRKLADIHNPNVPGYAAKLELSMDRFFAKMPVGRVVKRHNWSINTTGTFFNMDTMHMYEGQRTEKLKKDEFDPDRFKMRCERQTLHRLLENQDVIVFSFKTYQYPLRQLKEEGAGEDLASAIEGLSKGNVPQMAWYKRAVIWEDVVKEYLRS
ncbi:uncharacterized protein IWZ02DRAFT_430824 [Phyllosticta citriasiana]|uniref:Uncharacterized protein n=1 Tax=Phyllosticta citriasiana TaxID=595635 RepID=A0ABR1KHD3_9PEZI